MQININVEIRRNYFRNFEILKTKTKVNETDGNKTYKGLS